MIQSFLLSMMMYCLVTFPIYIVIRLFTLRKRNISVVREVAMLLFFLYVVSIFSQTIIPRFYIMDGKLTFDLMRSYVSHNFVPFQTIRMYVNELHGPIARIAFYNLAGNILLFIPFGFLIPALWAKLRSSTGMVFIALGIPLFIEGTQYFIGRSMDIDDVILNALAIVSGYIVFILSKHLMKTS